LDAITYAVDTLQAAVADREISLIFEPPAPLPMAYADPTRLRQILIILLDNAIKFTPAGGRVTVSARASEDDPLFLLMEVADTDAASARKHPNTSSNSCIRWPVPPRPDGRALDSDCTLRKSW